MKTPKQSGFVLVVGLMLLTVASGAVVSSMSVNKYQERQAGNYLRTNNYEAGADEAFRRFENNDKSAGLDEEKIWKVEVENKVSEILEDKSVENTKAIISYKDYEDLLSLPVGERESRAKKIAELRVRGSSDNSDEKPGDEEIGYSFTQPGIKKVVKLSGDRVQVVFWGRRALGSNSGIDYGNRRDVLRAVYSIGGSPGDSGGPSKGPVVGCEAIKVNGGGKINGDVRTLQPGAGVSLSGGTSVDGDVTTVGEVTTSGSSSVAGEIHANGDVTINSAAVYGGSIAITGSVFFENSATIKGDVSANGDVVFNNAATVEGNVSAGGKIIFVNSSASVGGNIESQEKIQNNHASWKADEEYAGGSIKIGSHTLISSVNGGECNLQVFSDNKNTLAEEMDSLLATVATDAMGTNKDIVVGNYPIGDGALTPNGLMAFDKTWNVEKDVILAEATTADMPSFDKPVSVVRTRDLTLKNGELNVSGGDVVLLVDGDLTLGSGEGKGLTIDQGSTLTIFVTGKTHIKSSTQMADIPATTNGRSTLSLYSVDKDTSAFPSGVLIDGDAQALANIYAPHANVSVTAGGGLRGSARGKTVTVDGGAGIEYVPRSTSGGGDDDDENCDDSSCWTLEGFSYGNGDN